MVKLRKRRLLFLGTISIVLVLSCLITLFSYLYEYISLSSESKNLENELLNLQESRQILKTDIIKLQDPAYIARYAKEKYLYSENGEYVLKLDEYTETKEIEADSNNFEIVIYGSIFLIVLVIIYLLLKKKSRV